MLKNPRKYSKFWFVTKLEYKSKITTSHVKLRNACVANIFSTSLSIVTIQARCVGCGENHASRTCPRKSPQVIDNKSPSMGYNCGEDHPDNFKSCKKFSLKHLFKKSYADVVKNKKKLRILKSQFLLLKNNIEKKLDRKNKPGWRHYKRLTVEYCV